ncbi:protein FANTASTIC FOUR 2-like [Phoenix dactylifera]|uniref:Protein FANTASTIC FOUR 2-like n=1 Tax=Phoenix dactylifera TaxID=42345 RepID=A0A8B9AY88_PHODC|nr:protein FANTASTIC FOUR 2-like [Phoenix dactylifera]
MLTLCKTTVHTLLGFSDHSTERRNPPYSCRNMPSPGADGLRLLAGDTPKPPNIVESSAVGPAGKPPWRTDLRARGLHDLDHGNLRLCTENLGSESCDDGGMGMDEIGGRTTEEDDRRLEARPWGRTRSRRWRAEAKFPPPLPWLVGRDGRRSRFMRVVREDGRIVLSEVRIERPEVLRASRRDGRLRLELVGSPNLQAMISDQEEEEEEEIEEEEAAAAAEEELAAAAAAAQRVKSEGARCVEELGGNGIAPWWSHHFATTA